MKIGLGTVQFGMKYGVLGNGKRVDSSDIGEILDIALNHSNMILDTSPAYGDSEQQLGSYDSIRQFRCVTKTPTRSHKCSDNLNISQIFSCFNNSLASMKIASAYGLLVHDCRDLLCDDGEILFDFLLSLKDRGLTKKIGVSVYLPEEAEAILRRFDIDILQVPLSPLNQSFLAGNFLDAISGTGVEIHARSVFLQGVLLAPYGSLPDKFSSLNNAHQRFLDCAVELGLTPLSLAMNFVLGQSSVQTVLVGVQSLSQFCSILKIDANPTSIPDVPHLHLADGAWNNPSQWPR